MLPAISRRPLPKALPFLSPSSICIRKFTAKGPCFSEQTIEQPAAVTSEQLAAAGGDQPVDMKPRVSRFYFPTPQNQRATRENQRLRANQRSLLATNRAQLVTQPRFRPGNRAASPQGPGMRPPIGFMPGQRNQRSGPRSVAPDVGALPVSSQQPMGNVISCVTAEEIDEILAGRITALYRRFYLPEIVKYVWLYTKLPVGRMSYVIEVGKQGWLVDKEDLPQYYKDAEVKRLAKEKEIREEILKKMRECPGIIQFSRNPEAASTAAARTVGTTETVETANAVDTTDTDTDNTAEAVDTTTAASTTDAADADADDNAEDTTAETAETSDQPRVPVRHVGHKRLGGPPRYAYKIEHMWELVYPKEGGISGAEMLEMEFLLRPPPPRFCNALPGMLAYLPLDKQKLLY